MFVQGGQGGVVLRTRYVEKYSLIIMEKILQLFHAKMRQCMYSSSVEYKLHYC